MVYAGVVTTIVQNHAGYVWLVSTSGKVYKAKEPAVDEVFRVSKAVDPCQRFIRKISE